MEYQILAIHKQAISQAVAAEREACAKIADSLARDARTRALQYSKTQKGHDHWLLIAVEDEKIAAEIRSRKNA